MGRIAAALPGFCAVEHDGNVALAAHVLAPRMPAEERTMIRTGLLSIAVVGAALSAPLAAAQNAPVENEDARFTFHRAGDGYLRLDGRSGQVSSCLRRPAGWLCKAVPDERAALESEIARLQSDNAALKKELLAHNLPLPAGIAPDAQSPKVDKPGPAFPDDAEIKRMMSFIENVWKRLVEMITNVQRDIMKKT
jgi:hypothetical protein